MNSWFAKVAGAAAMAVAVTAIGLGLGSGIAQAKPHPTPAPHPGFAATTPGAVTTPGTVDQIQDRFFPEGTRADTFFDRFLGVP